MIRIFIDIDNIVADFETAFRKFLNKKTGKKLKREDITEFEFYKCFNIPEEEEKKLHGEFSSKDGYNKLRSVRGSKEGIKRLMSFFKVKYITARPNEKRNLTLEWFRKNKIPIKHEHLIFSKEKKLYSSQFDIIIEDRWEDAIKLAENNKIVILFNYPWNRKVDKNGNSIVQENIIRVSNWEEATKSIESIAEEKFKKEPKEDILKIWKEGISVQMHFNQMIMRNRITITSVIYVAFSAALATFRWQKTVIEIRGIPLYLSDIIVFVAAIVLFSYFLIDTKYYLKLLIGSVNFTEKMDMKYKNLGLTTLITGAISHEEAKSVLKSYYFIIIVIALAIIVIPKVLIFFL